MKASNNFQTTPKWSWKWICLGSNPSPLKVHNCISTKMELWNNKHPLLFVWPTENVLRGKKKMHCVAKNTDVCTNVQSPLIWRGGRKTWKTRENSSLMRLFPLTVLWVWRSKDLLACNATYSIATKGQNAVFFSAFDLWPRLLCACASHISFKHHHPTLSSAYCTIQRMYSNSIPTLLKLLALQKTEHFQT